MSVGTYRALAGCVIAVVVIALAVKATIADVQAALSRVGG